MPSGTHRLATKRLESDSRCRAFAVSFQCVAVNGTQSLSRGGPCGGKHSVSNGRRSRASQRKMETETMCSSTEQCPKAMKTGERTQAGIVRGGGENVEATSGVGKRRDPACRWKAEEVSATGLQYAGSGSVLVPTSCSARMTVTRSGRRHWPIRSVPLPFLTRTVFPSHLLALSCW
jgi:hypothetical protein